MQCNAMLTTMPKATDQIRDSQITLRMPASLLDAIRSEAERERRSVADVIIFALEDRFPKRSRKGGK